MRQRFVVLLLLLAAVVAPALSPPAPAAAQSTAPGLGGTLFDTAAITAVQNPYCDFDGGTFTFEASGTVTGTAYPGTFTETGTITLGELNSSNWQPVIALTISFTIDSPNGFVTGTKVIVPGYGPTPRIHGVCTTAYPDGVPVLRVSTFATGRLRYSAQIVTPDGRTCTTEGPSDIFHVIKNSSVQPDNLTERFLSDISAPQATCAGGDGGGGDDTTPPVLALPGTVVADATGPAGAAVTFAVSAEDDVDGAVTPVCSVASGAVFPIGTTTVECTATDAADNAASGSFDVVVRGADAQLDDLVADVQVLNARNGIVNSLDAKLSAAREAMDDASAGDLESACGKLGAFINEVGAQADNQIGAADAQALLTDASRIVAVLGC
ncbi:MAG: hypothetical protein AVDCRST_MAG49-4093 [uncultured Thermomicrobiales bacterium]|uniref:HYR domain-containing protein n=1 Tax=uncultured Thermomicrobiales bacterium TaxID=1645740 RepID=A0A6J4VED6_9BACT|nr:MAG: hypothetical protein AVDCRST_MAG49-4093 [uncultured Thermomicrobiales bacterium]